MTITKASSLRPSLAKILLWTLATGVGTALGTLLPLAGFFLPISAILPCLVLQGLLLQRWCGLPWHLWTYRCCLLAIPTGLLTTVLMIPALFGAFEQKHATILLYFQALIYGSALGLGGVQALKPLRLTLRGWVPVSALAWSMGLFSMRKLFAAFDPSGGRLFRSLVAWGWPERVAAWGVGATQQLIVGLVAGLVSACLIYLFLTRSQTGAVSRSDKSSSQLRS